MSAELNVQVKLNLLEGEVKGLAEKVNKSIGGVLSRPSQPSQSPQIREEDKKAVEKLKQLNKQGISLQDAAKGMLRSLLMYRAISEALKMFKAALDSVVAAFEKAKKLYVGGALSGFGTRMQTSRTAIAGILGVSENDVIRFGEAYRYFSRQLKDSLDNIAKNARPLAETNMQWGVLKVKLESFASTVAVSLKPAIDSFIDKTGELVDFLQKNTATTAKIAKTAWSFTPTSLIAGGLGGLFRGLGSLSGGGSFMSGFLNQEMFGKNKSPNIPPQMKQLGASAWEKMGLVIGGTGGTNYAQQTATNTKTTNNLLRELKRSLDSQQQGHSVFQSQPSLA